MLPSYQVEMDKFTSKSRILFNNKKEWNTYICCNTGTQKYFTREEARYFVNSIYVKCPESKMIKAEDEAAWGHMVKSWLQCGQREILVIEQFKIDLGSDFTVKFSKPLNVPLKKF